MHGPDGRPVERGGERRAYPFPRALGDLQCLACPRWNHARGEPRPALDGYAQGLLDLATLAFGHGLWPEPGGALRQDPDLVSLLALVWQSPYRRALAERQEGR